jgi:hypothetical protein
VVVISRTAWSAECNRRGQPEHRHGERSDDGPDPGGVITAPGDVSGVVTAPGNVGDECYRRVDGKVEVHGGVLEVVGLEAEHEEDEVVDPDRHRVSFKIRPLPSSSTAGE